MTINVVEDLSKQTRRKKTAIFHPNLSQFSRNFTIETDCGMGVEEVFLEPFLGQIKAYLKKF